MLDLSKKLDVSFEHFYRGTDVNMDGLATEGSQLSDFFFCSAGDSFWSFVGRFVSIFFSYTVKVLCPLYSHHLEKKKGFEYFHIFPLNNSLLGFKIKGFRIE